MPQNLYLDECVSPLLRDRLRLHDPHALHFPSIEHASLNARGHADPQQLKYAVKSKAVFVTHNIKDFLWLHRWWKTLHAWDLLPDPHSGILAAPPSLPLDLLGAEIFKFLTQHPAPLLENNMYVYRQKQNQWVREHF